MRIGYTSAAETQSVVWVKFVQYDYAIISVGYHCGGRIDSVSTSSDFISRSPASSEELCASELELDSSYFLHCADCLIYESFLSLWVPLLLSTFPYCLHFARTSSTVLAHYVLIVLRVLATDIVAFQVFIGDNPSVQPTLYTFDSVREELVSHCITS